MGKQILAVLKSVLNSTPSLSEAPLLCKVLREEQLCNWCLSHFLDAVEKLLWQKQLKGERIYVGLSL